jgi:high-affinity Fe2+/Pb2+ permease
MWESIKKGLSLIGQSLGVVVVVAFAVAIFIVILPESIGWGAFLWGLGGFVLLFAAFLGIWGLGEENKK